jgi:EAL domain-containing protein (putative c-di-GMP-specific phosphodiesterase class I)
VESEQHLRQLAEIGCELVQGFFLARPLTPHAACSLLMKQFFAEVPAKQLVLGTVPAFSH